MENVVKCNWSHYKNNSLKIFIAYLFRDIHNICIALSRLNLLFTAAVTLKIVPSYCLESPVLYTKETSLIKTFKLC